MTDVVAPSRNGLGVFPGEGDGFRDGVAKSSFIGRMLLPRAVLSIDPKAFSLPVNGQRSGGAIAKESA